MTREIKFRAWDTKNKIMTYNPINCINFNGQLLFNDGQYHDIEKTDYVLMQFTGLKDKNGKEIYVGDVIKIKCNGDIIIGDVFYNQSRCCYMINHPAGYNGSFGLHTLTIEICDEFNIVGNIYQNFELLTK
jgi:uncharacterized phage protein (TIGR01671 family)